MAKSTLYYCHYFIDDGKNKFGNFTLYEKTIYVVVPGDDYHPIPFADNESTHPISSEYSARHIPKDDNHACCGNKVMMEMNPSTVRSIDNNYFTDGTTTYYCRSSAVNEDYACNIANEIKK